MQKSHDLDNMWCILAAHLTQNQLSRANKGLESMDIKTRAMRVKTITQNRQARLLASSILSICEKRGY